MLKTSLFSGCNLSPLLFSLFISFLGQDLNSYGLGINLGTYNLSCILFADDLVIFGSSRSNLEILLDKARTFFNNHHLTISSTKSKIMSFDASTGTTTFNNSLAYPPLTLDQVAVFKYLGIPISSSPYSLFSGYNDQVKKRAKNYLYRVLSLVKTGPDRSALAFSLWNQIALPSILYGAEIIPLLDSTIKEVEKCQAAVGKFILQVPKSTANVCANLDVGFRPVWAVVAEKVLLYANSIMSKPMDFLPKVAMTELLQQGSKYPYIQYLLKWKVKTECFGLHSKQIKASVRSSAISSVISQQLLTSSSTFAMSYPGSSSPNQWFRPKRWVSDSGLSKVFAEFRSCNAGLGNRAPAKNGQYYKLCPLCEMNGQKALNNEVIIKTFNEQSVKEYKGSDSIQK